MATSIAATRIEQLTVMTRLDHSINPAVVLVVEDEMLLRMRAVDDRGRRLPVLRKAARGLAVDRGDAEPDRPRLTVTVMRHKRPESAD